MSIEWVLNHLQVIIILAAVIASMVGRVMKFRGNAEQDNPRAAPEQASEDARRIQEEIRRKIAERNMPASAGPTAGRPPLLSSTPEEPSATSLLREKLERRMADHRNRQQAYNEERQRRLEVESRAEAAERKEAAVEKAAAQHAVVEAFPTARKITIGGSLVAGLREPGSLRRAIVLREIIDPPLALR